MAIALTTFAEIRKYIGGKTEFSDDAEAVITDMIASVTQRMEQECDRFFLIASRTKRRHLLGGIIPVEGCPISSISSCRIAASGRGFDLATAQSTQYEISPSGNSVSIYGSADGSLVEITYTGGLCSDAVTALANHPILVELCKLQVTSLWKRHANADRTGMDVGGSISWNDQYQLLKEVRDGLKDYRRVQAFL